MEIRGRNPKAAARQAQQAIKEATQEWSEKVKAAGQNAMDKISDAYGVAQDRAAAGARATDRTIRENPYAALGAVFACGLLIGWLIKPRK